MKLKLRDRLAGRLASTALRSAMLHAAEAWTRELQREALDTGCAHTHWDRIPWCFDCDRPIPEDELPHVASTLPEMGHPWPT